LPRNEKDRNAAILDARAQGFSITTIAAAYQLTKQRVSQILHSEDPHGQRGRQFLATPDAKAICARMLAEGASIRQIADALEVTRTTVRNWLKTQWSDLAPRV
jgi:uncharacterized protein (DUF433 family)